MMRSEPARAIWALLPPMRGDSLALYGAVGAWAVTLLLAALAVLRLRSSLRHNRARLNAHRLLEAHRVLLGAALGDAVGWAPTLVAPCGYFVANCSLS